VRAATQDGRDRLLSLDGERQSVSMMRLFGVTENELSQVGPSVLDIGAVAFHDRTDDRHYRCERVGDVLGRRLALFERRNVAGVLDQQEQLALAPGVKKQCSGTDVRLVGDLLRGDRIDAVRVEEFTCGGDDAFELLLFVTLATSDGLTAAWHGRLFL
jgi:hypothetical protein